MSKAVWTPPPDAMLSTNVGRFMVSCGVEELKDLRSRSTDDPDWFWDAVVRFLEIPFMAPYQRVLDSSRGIPWTTWFIGSRLNWAEVCCDRWAKAEPDGVAVVWEGEDGETRRWSWNRLRREADGLAGLLAERGVRHGDRVGVYVPMVPEAVATLLGVAKLGAVSVPLFSGYATDAIVPRLADAEAVALITVDGAVRRGKRIDMLATARAAAAQVESVVTIVIIPRLGKEDLPAAGKPIEVRWPGRSGRSFDSLPVESEHPLFVAYTSGTTGKPKGAVHVHGGWTAKVAEEGAFQMDCRKGDTLFWFTDMGWVMGPWEITAALSTGATLALYEGAPDWPRPGRLWAFLESHHVSLLGISPTLVRGLMGHGSEVVREHDLSALRMLGSTGEAWNLRPWLWYFETVGEGRRPIINFSGGTEVGACFLSPHPVEPLKPMSLGGPSLGMAVDVYDDRGRSVRGEVGELVCTRPWPGMTRGLFRDPSRYLETYWSRWQDVWVHGDWAIVDDDGDWYLRGRSDDTIKIAGKRLGPAEVESIVVSHPAVLEAAAIGIPDEQKGEGLYCFVVLAGTVLPSDALRNELTDLVADALGKSFKPAAGPPRSSRAACVAQPTGAGPLLWEDAGNREGEEHDEASSKDPQEGYCRRNHGPGNREVLPA